jgi:Asp/Glu/hydantoin racemase
VVRGDAPTVAMVHATPAAMAPAVAAFGERFPEAGLWHLLDDRLVSDAEEAGGLVPPLRRRMLSLIGHAVSGGADGVLLTCSMYGPVARLAAQLWDRPVAGSDEAVYQRVAAERPTRVAVLGSLETAVADSAERLRQVAGPGTEVRGVLCPGAARAAMAGDGEALLASLRSAAEPLVGEVDVFLLGQYSLTTAHAELQAGLGVPVWSPAHVAADVMARRLRPAGR